MEGTGRTSRSQWDEDWLALAASFALMLQAALIGIAGLLAMLPGWSAVSVQSGSMEPLLHVGDVALIHADDHPEPGEVVLVDRSGELPLLHRLVRWNSDGTATTQGDANPEPDSTPVGPKEIRGVGRVALPAIGMPSVWVAHRQVGAIVGAALAELLLTVAAARGALRHHGQRAERSGLPGIVPLDDRTLRELRAAAAGRAVPRDLATRLR